MEDELFILWTSADPITGEKMVCMYAHNSLLRGWWKKVTVIIWGATAKLVAEDGSIRSRITEMLGDGVSFSACRACAEQLGVVERLEELEIEVKYWGEPLTEILKSGGRLLTI